MAVRLQGPDLLHADHHARACSTRRIEELDFLLDHDARVILMRPAPAWGYQGPRSFALPEFDPYWSKVRGVGDPRRHPRLGQRATTATPTSGRARRRETQAFAEPQPFSATVQHSPPRHPGRRAPPSSPTGRCARHPEAPKIALIENGAGWVPGLLEHLDHTWTAPCPRPSRRSRPTPSSAHFWIHPFHEEDPRKLVELLGADNIIFGSDYPHVEGLANPISYVDELVGLPEEDIRKIMGGNMMDLLGTKVPAPA